MKRGYLVLMLPVLMGGCAQLEKVGLVKAENKAMPKGEREAVILTEEASEPKASADAGPVSFAPAEPVKEWHQVSHNPTHVIPHGHAAEEVKPVWEAKLGVKANLRQRLLCEPIVANGLVMIYTPDSYVTAYDTQTGKFQWSIYIKPEQIQEAILGGGLAYHNGNIFVTTPFAELFAIHVESGTPLWSAKTNSPLRGAPAVRDGRVYAVSLNNELNVYDEKTGSLLWNHAGVMESSGLLGGSTPTITDTVVLAPYTSGELFALQVENGYPLWSENLSSTNRTDSFAGMPHIRARPVVQDGVAYVASQAGRVAAVDVRTGEIRWSHDFGGAETPVVSGDSLFMITNDNHLLCMNKQTGKVRWTKSMDKWEDDVKRKGRIVWNGPVLAGSQLFLTGSHGTLISIHAKDGSKAYEYKLPGKVVVPPIAVDGTVYVVTESGSLVAFR